MALDIGIVGGGPAGLYFALLMKRLDPAHRVRVVEQNPAGATFGFGVVFSDSALSFVREADPDLLVPIEAAMEHWGDLTVVHRDTAMAVDGNGFSAIGRLELLAMLQAMCRAAGVELVFDTALADVSAFAVCDLVVGADGLNSLVRSLDEAVYRPSVETLTNRFAWYGTRQPFDTLTLTFREFEGGAYVAHHYRYAPAMSTFIVECDAGTWVRAGFAGMSDDESRAYCERIFARDLGGHPLISNRSIWRNFPVLTCARWHCGNRVLIGDAVRTAHFSIGSGTRLAMEDAIFLSRAIAAEGNDVGRALPRFEAERRPIVEKILTGAAGSYAWYESFHERMHLGAYDFAYDYMTRSGRMSEDRLRRIAPRFMSAYDESRAA